MHIQWKNTYVVSQSLFESSDGVYQLSQASVISMLVFYAMIIVFICGIILYKLNQYKKLHIAKLIGRVCGAKRPHSVFEQPIYTMSM